MSYPFTLRRFWWSWFKQDIMKIYYKIIYKFIVGGINGTMMPSTGKGKFVSVYSKAQIIQIKHEDGYHQLKYDEIRLIPYKENHGIMVERFKNGVMFDRHLLDILQFNKDIIFASNVEQLAVK